MVPVDSLLDGGNGNDRLIGSIASDILFGGAGMDWLEGGAGHDLLYGDYDYNFGNPVQAAGSYDKLDGGTGYDVLLALGTDHLAQATPGDTSFDRVVGDRFGLVYPPTLQAEFVALTNQSIAETLQLRLNLSAGYPF
jgi:Ca2+-binding RTX toxin-like protein